MGVFGIEGRCREASTTLGQRLAQESVGNQSNDKLQGAYFTAETECLVSSVLYAEDCWKQVQFLYRMRRRPSVFSLLNRTLGYYIAALSASQNLCC